jgi:preprotein translocase subunit SecG
VASTVRDPGAEQEDRAPASAAGAGARTSAAATASSTAGESRCRAEPSVAVAGNIDAVEFALSVFQVFLSVVLIFLVLMHSGKDSGLSGAFGVGTGAGPFGGGSLVERNLNIWTVIVALAFVGNTIVLLKI